MRSYEGVNQELEPLRGMCVARRQTQKKKGTAEAMPFAKLDGTMHQSLKLTPSRTVWKLGVALVKVPFPSPVPAMALCPNP